MTIKSAYKIMIVEDEAVIVLKLEKLLTTMGYDVIGVSYSGEEALEKARSLRPDIILMDIMIPGKLDGIKVAKMVKSELDIPVIFLTAFSEDEIIERAKLAEPFGYILKPFQNREIKATIEVAFYKKEMENTLKESEAKFRALAENANEGILIAKDREEHVYANKRAAEITGFSVSELLKMKIKDLAHPDEFEKIQERYCTIISGKPFKRRYETTIIRKDGKDIQLEVASARTKWEGKPADIVIFRDITNRIKTEKALLKSHNDLDRRVKERTFELKNALETLQRNKAELAKRKLVLERLNQELMDTNLALSVVADNKDKEKQKQEEQFYALCNGKIIPILKDLQNDVYCNKRQADLELIISYLKEAFHESSRYRITGYNLSVQEMRVALMIKHGLSNQQIADMLCLSLYTVKTHRKNIRKKFSIKDPKVDLVSYLESRLESD